MTYGGTQPWPEEIKKPLSLEDTDKSTTGIQNKAEGNTARKYRVRFVVYVRIPGGDPIAKTDRTTQAKQQHHTAIPNNVIDGKTVLRLA